MHDRSDFRMLLRSPTHADLAAWAGEDGVVRPDPALVRQWHIGEADRKLLTETGLPRLRSLFVPIPQRRPEPAWPPFYILGREAFGRHPHDDADADCGCGQFGLDPRDGTVWQLYPEHPDATLFVNSDLRLFVYFLHMLGAASARYRNLPDREMIRRTEQVWDRLRKREPAFAKGRAAFWTETFARAWG